MAQSFGFFYQSIGQHNFPPPLYFCISKLRIQTDTFGNSIFIAGHDTHQLQLDAVFINEKLEDENESENCEKK